MPLNYNQNFDKGGYPTGYGNVRSGSLLADIGWDTGLGVNQFLPQELSGEQLYGQNFDYLQNLLKGQISNPNLDPALQAILSSGKRDLGQATNEALRTTREGLASSGFRGSGANVISDIFGKRSDALADLEANVGGMGFQAKQNAIANLLGLNQFQAGQNVGQSQFKTGAFQNLLAQLLGRQGQKEQLDFAKDQSGFNWGNLIGDLFGNASQAASSFFLTQGSPAASGGGG